MTGQNHSVVWIDHRGARVFRFSADEADRPVVWPIDPHIHVHHKANTIGIGHGLEDKAFLQAVDEAIGASKATLIAGPGVAKTALVKHIARYDPVLQEHVAAGCDRCASG